MNNSDYITLKVAKDTFKYHSFHYVDEADIKDYEIIKQTNDVLLIKGTHPSQQKPHIHFFVNELETLIESLADYDNHLIEFVPKDWMRPLEKKGYMPYAVFRDYWYPYNQPLKTSEPLVFATNDDIEDIAILSQTRKGSSRAFSGETIDVVSQWVTNQVEGVDDTCVLLHKHTTIDGAVMIGLYGTEEKRTLWVRMICVRANAQNQGIGYQLLNQALYYGQMHHAKRAFLMADDLNENAIHLYQKVGFKPDITSEQIDMITK
jgi:ribosomal protein S18 acetylase RimI-like enzyme